MHGLHDCLAQALFQNCIKCHILWHPLEMLTDEIKWPQIFVESTHKKKYRKISSQKKEKEETVKENNFFTIATWYGHYFIEDDKIYWEYFFFEKGA